MNRCPPWFASGQSPTEAQGSAELPWTKWAAGCRRRRTCELELDFIQWHGYWLIQMSVCLSVWKCLTSVIRGMILSLKQKNHLDFFGVCPKLWGIGVKLRMNISASVVWNFSFHTKLCGNTEAFGLFFDCLGSLWAFFVFVNDLKTDFLRNHFCFLWSQQQPLQKQQNSTIEKAHSSKIYFFTF